MPESDYLGAPCRLETTLRTLVESLAKSKSSTEEAVRDLSTGGRHKKGQRRNAVSPRKATAGSAAARQGVKSQSAIHIVTPSGTLQRVDPAVMVALGVAELRADVGFRVRDMRKHARSRIGAPVYRTCAPYKSHMRIYFRKMREKMSMKFHKRLASQ